MPTPAAVYARRRRAGICVRCGKNPALPGRRDCEHCRRLPINPDKCGVPLEQALAPSEAAAARHFLRCLTMAARRVPAGTRLDIAGFISAYREIYGLPASGRQWVAAQQARMAAPGRR